MFKVITLSIFCAMLLACQSSGVVVKNDDTINKKKYDESFDPNSLNDDDIVISGTPKPTLKNTDAQPGSKKETANYREMNGYRVQVMVTKNIESATLVEDEAREQFKLEGYKTYLVFEGPLYKVRIGDAHNRGEAEKIRDLARDLNYRDAYIVPSKVNVLEGDN